VFGKHPYSRLSPTPEMLDNMTRDQLVAFREATYIPNNAVFMVVGDVDREEIITRTERIFASWKPGALPDLDLPPLPQRSARSIYVVDRPGSAQSNIVIANQGITRTSPDYFPMLLMHTILGANASSRLFMNLREEKGYTYGAYSNLDARRLAGTFRATAEVRTPVTGASLHEFFYELGRIRDEAVTDDELKNAKSYLAGVFPIRIETQDGLIDQLVSIRMYDLPTDYLETYREQINAVTAADIQRVAQTHVTPDLAAVVIVGDAAEISEQVKAYADTIELYDTDGKAKGRSQTAGGRKTENRFSCRLAPAICLLPSADCLLRGSLQPLNIQHTRNVLDRTHHFVQMLYIKDLYSNFDAAFLIGTD
jgi:zinc protease